MPWKESQRGGAPVANGMGKACGAPPDACGRISPDPGGYSGSFWLASRSCCSGLCPGPGVSGRGPRSCNAGIPSPGYRPRVSASVVAGVPTPDPCVRAKPGSSTGSSLPVFHRGATPGACLDDRLRPTVPATVTDDCRVFRWGEDPAKALPHPARFRLGPICPARANPAGAVSGFAVRGAAPFERRGPRILPGIGRCLARCRLAVQGS